jgi:hypothetical protein
MASPTTHETQAVSCFSVLPPEKMMQIFGFFDFQTLGRIAQVCKFFEQLQNDLWVITFGSKQMDRCVLDLRKKTLTILSPWPGIRHCFPAMNYPAIPKGSFVVFFEMNASSAVIKDREGSVQYAMDIEAEDRKKDVVLKFRKESTQYTRFKIIAPNPKSMKDGYVDAQQLFVLNILQNGNSELNDKLKQWHKS